MCKNLNNTKAYDPTTHLFQRLEKDMLACHHQMEILKILFKNFENSWLAITLEYKVVKVEMEEKR
jgi:hypothetical protein